MEEESFTDISLRPLDLLDIDAFMEWAVDDKVAHFCTWEPYNSKEDGINFIRNIVLPHQWYRAISIDNRPIGSITVTPNSGSGDRCRGELGYVLAFKMVAETIFDELPHLERLEALVDVENLASQRVLEKAGFKREGVLRKYMIIKGSTRDMVIFSLLSSDSKT